MKFYVKELTFGILNASTQTFDSLEFSLHIFKCNVRKSLQLCTHEINVFTETDRYLENILHTIINYGRKISSVLSFCFGHAFLILLNVIHFN